MKNSVGLFALIAIFTLGFTFLNAFGEIEPNNAFTLEGSGFAVTEEIIRTSEIDVGISTQQQAGSSIKAVLEDGFITLDEQDFIPTELQATFLREGKYIRINGSVEDESGDKGSLKLFGRLVEESKSASIYGFTGRITNGDNTYKTIYTAKLSTLSKITSSPTEPKTSEEQLTIHILKGSSSRGVSDNYIGLSSGSTNLRYFSQDRISVEPGTTITIVNDDTVSHRIQSGKENYGDRYNQYTPDGRISTGEILPGKSTTITFDDAGFYRLFDPNYQWMNIISYVFPNPDSVILKQNKPTN